MNLIVYMSITPWACRVCQLMADHQVFVEWTCGSETGSQKLSGKGASQKTSWGGDYTWAEYFWEGYAEVSSLKRVGCSPCQGILECEHLELCNRCKCVRNGRSFKRVMRKGETGVAVRKIAKQSKMMLSSSVFGRNFHPQGETWTLESFLFIFYFLAHFLCHA